MARPAAESAADTPSHAVTHVHTVARRVGYGKNDMISLRVA
jgi:hypothetical protein